MTNYALYVESGPRHKHTMVHVLDLLGCVVQGPTTEEALVATPDGIREFLAFLHRHGADVVPNAAFDTVVKEHVTKGSFIGQGNPPDGFAPDFAPLSEDESRALVERLRWMRDDFRAVLERLAPAELAAIPSKGRPVAAIIEHVTGASAGYLRYTVGKVDGLAAATRAANENIGDLAALDALWALDGGRWAALTEEERTRTVQHGQEAWTARRGLRRALEHQWEHLDEVSRRQKRG